MNTINNPIDQVRALTDRSSYGFVNTREVLDTFSRAGWSPVSTQFGKVKAERDGFQKHLIRLENPLYPSIEGLSQNNKSVPQLVLLNSHDCSTSMQLFFGLVRIACLNGIIAGTAINSMRLVHSKSITQKLPQAIDYMVNNFDTFTNQVVSLQNKTMTVAAQHEFVKRIYKARLENVNNIESIDFSLPHALRNADTGMDAYTIFNLVQEKLVRGGISYVYTKHTKNDQGNIIDSRLVSSTTRKIASVTSQVKLNQLVYDTALELVA
jgi:hypothetical protein